VDRSKCVILVPAGGPIEPECEEGLRALELRGYAVRRVRGYAAIDQARSQMATDALHDGFDELFWIDADVSFDPDDVDRLRAHALPFVCGIYPKKGPRALACHLLPETERIVFGPDGGLLEILYAAGGFTLTHRDVYAKIAAHDRLPTCNLRFDRPLLPYFLPLILDDGKGGWYLGEDFAFSERARRAGIAIFADSTIRLRHVGRYAYSWEDAGGTIARYPRYTFHVNK
jgi:hypothetical protein